MSEPPLRTLSLHPGDPTWGSDPPVFKGWLPCLPAVCSEAGPLTFELGLLSPSDRLSICLLATPFNARPHSCFPAGTMDRPACVRFPLLLPKWPRTLIG